jgi:hypothetical protein
VRALSPCLIATLRLFRPLCWLERQYLSLYSGVTWYECSPEHPISCLRWFVTFISPFSQLLGCTKNTPNLFKKFPSYLSTRSCVATVAVNQSLLLYSKGPVFRKLFKVGNLKFVLIYESFQVNFTFILPCIVIEFCLNNQPDAWITQIYSVIELYMFWASSLSIIRSSLL